MNKNLLWCLKLQVGSGADMRSDAQPNKLITKMSRQNVTPFLSVSSILPILWSCRLCKLNPPLYSEVPNFAKANVPPAIWATLYCARNKIWRSFVKSYVTHCDNNIKLAVYLVLLLDCFIQSPLSSIIWILPILQLLHTWRLKNRNIF